MTDYNELYPQLPSNDSENFRLQQATKWLSDLEKELSSYEKIYKKYNRARSILVTGYCGW